MLLLNILVGLVRLIDIIVRPCSVRVSSVFAFGFRLFGVVVGHLIGEIPINQSQSNTKTTSKSFDMENNKFYITQIKK
jgi:hypothetical protein